MTRRRKTTKSAARIRPTHGAPGQLLGIDAYPVGSEWVPGQRRRWEVPGGELETDDPAEVFRARVAPFSLDSILNAVAAFTRARAADPTAWEQNLQRAGEHRSRVATFLLRRLVTQAIAVRAPPDQANQAFTMKWLLLALESLMDIAADADATRLAEGGSEGAFKLRVMAAQQHDHLGYEDYVRELWLARRTVDRCRELGFDLDFSYEKNAGVTFTAMAALSFFAWTTIVDSDTGVINRATWLGPNSPVNVESRVVEAFFNHVSAAPSKIAEHSKAPAVVEVGFEPYALSPLVKWPLVERTDGLLLAPIANGLLERPTYAFHIDARKAADRVGGKAPAILTAASGDVYEAFVGEVLRGGWGGNHVLRADDVFPTDRQRCDFVVSEGQERTLVEVKGYRFPLKTLMTMERENLRQELEAAGGVVEGLRQLLESARRVRECQSGLPKRALLRGLLVLRGEHFGINMKFVRDILWEALNDLGYSDRSLLKFTICDAPGLDLLARYGASGGGLGALISEMATEPRFAQLGVREAIIRKGHKREPHPLRDEYYSSFGALVASRLRPEYAARFGADAGFT